ncbi:hypothetical protein GUITHDRAFT_138845 [Guillardia theta CCMP2712]|uniref:Uncharacterized protein n=1 Tax=Guillardia theta (strain CCMP2712) TaxID=905079 RepID=L1JAS0_GUITC|nr:hypothetical protein GUITHDRAFT_138845 [Guillardia theta CCMP2712]EKX45626.1 hypothetical protein GUITHDRAFT_138845 [Guillardia theta CCMP2712]|eukprot:XP_005832606.1 hypothetical protein GUITHDRAFT_138845 [Guillardia theta CCMP2712]
MGGEVSENFERKVQEMHEKRKNLQLHFNKSLPNQSCPGRKACEVFNFSGFFNPALVFSFQQPGVLYESRSNDGTAVTLRDNTGILETYLQSYPRTGSSNDFQYAYVPSFRCSAPYTYYTCLNANYDSTASWQLVYSDVLNKDYSIDFSNTSLQYSFQTPQLCEWRTGAVDASVSRGVYDGVRSSRVEEIIAALQSDNKSYTFLTSFWTGTAVATKGSGTVPCFDCACKNGYIGDETPVGDNDRSPFKSGRKFQGRQLKVPRVKPSLNGCLRRRVHLHSQQGAAEYIPDHRSHGLLIVAVSAALAACHWSVILQII